MDDGKQLFEAQQQLLHIFLLLDGPSSREYQKCMMASLLIWHHYKKTNHPVWKMFKSNSCAFNEESGEICFSVLARGVAKNGARSDAKTISSWYRLIHTKIEVAQDIGVDICGEDFQNRQKFHSHVDPHGDDVNATAHFFKRMIRELKAGRFWHYDSKLGNTGNTKKVARTVVRGEYIPDVFLGVEERAEKVLLKVQENFSGYWVTCCPDVWPACVPKTISDSEDELVLPLAGRSAPAMDRKAPGVPPSKKRKHNDIDPLLDRMLRVPARQMGVEWAEARYGKAGSHKAFHHGHIQTVNRSTRRVQLEFPGDDDLFEATLDEVKKWLVPISNEDQAKDGLST